MTKKESVMLCLKILGIYFLSVGLANLPHLIENFTDPRNFQWSFFVSPLLYFLIGIILFSKARSFSRFVTEGDTESDVHFTPTSNTVRIALIVLGVYVLSNAIPNVFQIFANALAYQLKISSIPEHLRQQQQHFIYIVSPTIKIVIGLWLVLGTKGIVKLLGKFDNTFKEIDESNKKVEQRVAK